MNASREPRYEIDQFGSLVFVHGADRRVIAGESLAILFSADEDMPCLFKHGAVEGVVAYSERLRHVEPVAMISIPFAVLRDEILGPQVLEEVNLCLAISGRVGKLQERLRAIANQTAG